MRLRVMVYNVKAFRRGVRGIAALVAEHGPDVALVQECGPRHRLRRFAGALGMEAASAHVPFRRSIHNAVLVRPPWRVLSSRLHRFPRESGRSPRGALIIRMGRSGFRMWVVSLHLGLHPGARRRNAEELTSWLPSLGGAVLAGGDMNEGPDGRAVRWVSDRLWDCFDRAGEGPGETYPAADPQARIDYLFVNDAVEVERTLVVRGPGPAACSDHLPVLVDLRLRAQSPRARGEAGPPREETVG